jgi:hypothetical protein
MPAVTDMEVYTLWWITIAVGVVVVVVAAGLLTNILIIAKDIESNVGTIVAGGGKILENTANLRGLTRVYAAVLPMRDAGGHIDQVARAIAAHGTTCRHCPACVRPWAHPTAVGSRTR